MREQEYDNRGQDNRRGQGRGQDNRRGQGRGQEQGNVQEFNPSQFGFPERPVADVALVAEVIEDAVAQGLNVLAPVTRLQYLPPGYQVAIRVVHFTMGGEWKAPQGGKQSNGTWYAVDGGAFALLKTPLRQLLAAAGGSVETFRMDDRSSGAFWEFQARVKVRTMDGTWRTITATKDLDLRDNSPVVESWVKNAQRNGQEGGASKRILQAREAGGRMCEAKAVNAAIRDALGLKASYTREEAGRPFMFPLLVYTPTSEAALQMQAAVELGVVAQVYGPSAQGRAFAPAGSIIDLDATEGQRPALVDRGQHSGPDAEAELRRRGERQTVHRGPRQEDEPWADEDIPFDDREEEREPPRQAGRQSSRQGPAPSQGGGGGNGGDALFCSEPGCGRQVSDQVGDYSIRRFGQVLCMDHQPKPSRK